MYSPENGPPGRRSRLLIDFQNHLEYEIRPPRVLKELQGEVGMVKELFAAVDPNFDGLVNSGGGDGGACVEGHHSPWR